MTSTKRNASAIGNAPTKTIKKSVVVNHQTKNAAAVEAQAPATVARRLKSPSQKAMPIIGEIFQKISSPFTTPGNQKANSTPPATTTNDVTRPTNK